MLSGQRGSNDHLVPWAGRSAVATLAARLVALLFRAVAAGGFVPSTTSSDCVQKGLTKSSADNYYFIRSDSAASSLAVSILVVIAVAAPNTYQIPKGDARKLIETRGFVDWHTSPSPLVELTDQIPRGRR